MDQTSKRNPGQMLFPQEPIQGLEGSTLAQKPAACVGFGQGPQHMHLGQGREKLEQEAELDCTRETDVDLSPVPASLARADCPPAACPLWIG